MKPIDLIVYNTVRIISHSRDGSTSSGTGFYVLFLYNQSTSYSFPAIITNKHVIHDSYKIEFTLTAQKKDEKLPDIRTHYKIGMEEPLRNTVFHPSEEIDLAAIMIGNLLNNMDQDGHLPFIHPITLNLVPDQEKLESLFPMEEVVMIGYPNGIWDEAHNMPVIRKGITATHPMLPWNNKSEFLTDIASFPGSSGSPVYILNNGGYMDREGYCIGERIMLLGIHRAGFMHSIEGNIEIVQPNTFQGPISRSQIPNNLGLAVSSKELLTLEKEVEKFRDERAKSSE